MRRSTAILLALSLAVSPGMASALGMERRVPLQGPYDERPHPHLTTMMERLRMLGVPPEVLAPIERGEETFTGSFSFTVPAGDLDGSGRRDLLAVSGTYEFTIDDGPLPFSLLSGFDFSAETTIRALSGATGRVLWRKSYDDFVFPVPARVGPQERPGAYAIHGAFSMMGPIDEYRIMIAALDGSSGDPLWERVYETKIVDLFPALVIKDAPFAIDFLDALPGRTTDVLVGVGDVVMAGTGYAIDLGVHVVHGGTGEAVEHLDRHRALNWMPLPWAVNDIDGDGKDDYVVGQRVVNTREPLPETDAVTAYRGGDGRELWSVGLELRQIAWVYRLPDVTGDGTPDLALVTATEDRGPRRLETYLVDGAGAGAHWRRPGAWPYSPGDINGDGHPDVITRWVFRRFERGVMTTRLWAFTQQGRSVWERTIPSRFQRLECRAEWCVTWTGVGFREIGDLQLDGLEDMVVRLFVEQDPGRREDFTYTVAARHGRVVVSGGGELHALGGAVDAAGTDVADVLVRGESVKVRARRGSDGSMLWDATLVTTRPWSRRAHVEARALRLDGDRCADVLVMIDGPKHGLLFALNGGDGSLMWSFNLRGQAGVARAATGSDLNPAC